MGRLPSISLSNDKNENILSNNLKEEKISISLLVLMFFCAIGGFLNGYNTSVVSGAIILIKNDFVLSTVWHEWIVSITIIAAWFGSLLAAPMADYYGRKIVIMVSTIFFVVSPVTMAVARDKEMILAGRALLGLGIGLSSMCIPIYISELSPPSFRGRLTVVNVLFLTFGQFLSALVCGAFANVEAGWRWMFGVATLPALLQMVGFIFAPESPRWLSIKGKKLEAREALLRFRHSDTDLDAEIDGYTLAKQTSIGIIDILRSGSVRRALFIGCLLQFFQQMSGINAVMYYIASILKMAGVSSDSTAIWMSAAICFFNFLFTFVGIFLVERAGRRPLVLVSLFGLSIALFILGLSFQIDHFGHIDDAYVDLESKCSQYVSCLSCVDDPQCGFCYKELSHSEIANSSCIFSNSTTMGQETCSASSTEEPIFAYDWCPSQWVGLSVAGLCLFLIFYAAGIGSMPWTINSEIFPLSCRAACVSLCTSINWATNFLVSVTFLTLTEALRKHGTFYLYMAVSLVGFLIFLIALPETKGVELEDMDELFSKPLCSAQCFSKRRKHKTDRQIITEKSKLDMNNRC